MKHLGFDMSNGTNLHYDTGHVYIHEHVHRARIHSDSTDSVETSLPPLHEESSVDKRFPAEIWKTILAAAYMNCVLLITSFVMVSILHQPVSSR